MRTTLLVLLLLADPAWADPPKLSIPAEVKAAGEYVTFTPNTDAVSVTYVAQSAVEPFPSAFLKDPRAFVLPTRGLAAGRYRFVAVAASNAGEQSAQAFAVLVGDAPPGPPDPPKPPDPPAPPPGPAPIPAPGFRVLFVLETADLARLPAGQRTIFTAAAVRDYLNARCARDANGWPGWRVWDQHVNASAEAAHWQAALARPRKGLPWLVVSDGKTGWEGPLPATVEETLALLKGFGG